MGELKKNLRIFIFYTIKLIVPRYTRDIDLFMSWMCSMVNVFVGNYFLIVLAIHYSAPTQRRKEPVRGFFFCFPFCFLVCANP